MRKHVNFLVNLLLLCCLTMQADAQRTVINFDEGWKFHFGNAADPAKDFGCGTEYFNYLTKANSIHNTGPYSVKFDDKDWKSVTLPHDFVVDLPFDSVASHSHGYKTVGYKFPETSVGWYRKTFKVEATDKGKQFQILFDGIFRNSRVWVNGFYCGGEENGYLSQCYDITSYLKYGEDNIVCVRADATLETGWFYEGGGIYRHVKMIETDPVHIANDGIAIRTKLSSKDLTVATVNVRSAVKNSSHEGKECYMNYTIFDAEGNEIAKAEGDTREHVTIAPQKEVESSAFKFDIPMTDPHLWSPEVPYLYTLQADLWCGGKIVDSEKVKFGVRHIKFHKKNGLLVNGIRTKMKGFNQHQDHAGVGVGIPDALQIWRLRQLKALGCNTIRSSHNPMSPALLDACDSIGMMVIDENRLSGTSEKQISELERMIDRDRNHPCIVLWSLGNEEWGIEWDERGEEIARTMKEYAHNFDSSRPATFATSSGPTVEVPLEVAGYNYIMQNPIDSLHKVYPERACFGSEETTGCGTRGIYYDDPEGRWMKALNRAPNGKDSIMNCIERGWQFYASRQWTSGCCFWTGFDYRGEPNPMKYPAVDSEFGVLDYCGFPKDEAYYLKSWWTYKPVVHILPHWNLTGHEGENVDVWVYSNCDEVQLVVNGVEMEKKIMPKNGHLAWNCVYQPGEIRAVGYNAGTKVLEDVIQTADEAATIVTSADRSEIQADGQDVSVVTVSLKDKKDRFCPTACNELTLHIDGDAKILGVGNGDPACHDAERPTDATAHDFKVKAFNGYAQVLVQSNKAAGKATLTVSSGALKAAKQVITIK